MDPERRRLAEDGDDWRRWGPYLSERAWGTVREDYSAEGDAWSSFPHDHARSRAYRWSEDGLGGICDADQVLCFAFAFWNGRDPILKERIFGLTGPEGNHGEDAKEYWWYLDSTPTHSWMRWRYAYPQQEFPYARLIEENRTRGKLDPEFELTDSGALDAYWDIEAEYAKSTPGDLCIRVTVRNAGPETQTLHVLPTLWFRNRWSWDPGNPKPKIGLEAGALVAGDTTLQGDGDPEPLFCDNETNARRLWGSDDSPPYPKDGINDHVVDGKPTVNPGHAGTKAALHYRLTVEPRQTAEIRLRLGDPAQDFDATLAARRAEADEFYAALAPQATEDEAAVMRQAFGGMLWSKQFYHYDVDRWLRGDPGQPAPPDTRHQGRNAGWRHVDNHDVISMPDKWEYPWFAAWDLAFHCITLAHVDPGLAKDQLRLLTREWYMHPNGQLPAYEWNFGDVNPPVHALAALAVYELDGAQDRRWLARIFHKLLLGFTWWANVKDAEGDHLFGGGFLGMDNIGPFDRSAPQPPGTVLEQADGTGWMALYCLNMLEIALELARHDDAYEDVAVKFFEHFTLIAQAINDRGLWDEQDGFYYDQLRRHGEVEPIRMRSMTGLIPVCAVAVGTADGLPEFRARIEEFLAARPEYGHALHPGPPMTLALVGPERLARVLERVADEREFLSPYGLRALSKEMDDYEPGESHTGMFGGNSNWRGPVWFPVNYLVIAALRRFHAGLGDTFTIEFPRGSQQQHTLEEMADALAERLIALFLPDDAGRRPVFGEHPPTAGAAPLFHEYFHGDDGRGLGASHQTGWTGLVADLIVRVSTVRAK